MPYTADEVYSYLPGKNADSVHLLEFAPPCPGWSDPELESRWDRLLKVRDEGLKLLEAMRHAGTIGAPLEAAVKIGAPSWSEGWGREWADELARGRDLLKDLLIVSDVKILSEAESAGLESEAKNGATFGRNGTFGRFRASPALVMIGERARGAKCERCWCYYDDGYPKLCPRCRVVVRELGR